jgi:23S rRNA pseudouridine1911/1915/1917 synthase
MASRIETLSVEQSLPRGRLDVFLRERFPAVSRGTFQRLIEEGHIRVNGETVKSTYSPLLHDSISIFFPEPVSDIAQPEDLPLKVLHEDEDLLVINKPPGLVVHPAAGHAEHTIVNALLHHCRGQLSGIGGVARPGIVHRLDKDTSGCMVVAKNDAAHVALAAQFEARTIKKLYRAIVCGHMPSAKGEIKANIARHPSHRKRMAVTESMGREAWTSYEVRERLHGADDVEAVLHTGRTHQIRVHFQFVKCPLVGDETYGSRQNSTLRAATGIHPGRQMLHAYSLGFKHPRTKKLMSFKAELPEDFAEALLSLRQSNLKR